MAGEHVLICVAWPYANGPLHLGHVAGCYLPPDIQFRFERALGNRVLMVSGSDEHGTPITVTPFSVNSSPLPPLSSLTPSPLRMGTLSGPARVSRQSLTLRALADDESDSDSEAEGGGGGGGDEPLASDGA